MGKGFEGGAGGMGGAGRGVKKTLVSFGLIMRQLGWAS